MLGLQNEHFNDMVFLLVAGDVEDIGSNDSYLLQTGTVFRKYMYESRDQCHMYDTCTCMNRVHV